jgi:hypothetical protein
VGAGLTAAHLITGALAEGHRVHWVFRESQERFQCADVNSAFFRPEGRARFSGGGREHRMAMMRTHRRASIMYEFRPLLRQAEADGRLVVHRGRQVSEIGSGTGGVTVRLTEGQPVVADRAVLALGTVVSTGRGLLPAGVVGDEHGWPELDERMLNYRGASRVLAVGAAAAMVLGPAARNIDGHRIATARVAAAVAMGLREGRLPAPDAVPAELAAGSLMSAAADG